MSERLDQDLARWEEGEISFDEVAARHPVQDARELRRLRDRLAFLATEPTPEPDPGWAALKEQLADRRPSLLRRIGQRAYRPVLVAAAVTLFTAGLALGLESVRQGAVWFLRTVAGFLVAGAAAISFLLLESPPTAEDAALSGPEDATVVWNPGVSDEDQDELTCFIVMPAAHGTARVDSDCTGGSYVPDPDFHGKDAFMYRASDGTTGSAPAAVNITVQPVNDDPVAADDGAATPEDTPTTIEVLANDEDVDGNSFESNNSTLEDGADNASLILNSVSGARGSVSVGVGGRLTYTPDPNFTGSDSFKYRVDDGDGGSDMGTVLVRVNPVNDPPAATDVSIGGNEDVAVDWVPSVSDVDGDALSCSIDAPATHGAVVVNSDCSGGSYSPDPDFNGTDSFTYSVSDGSAKSISAAVTLTIQAANDSPVAADDTATADEGASITIQVLANDADVDGDPLTVAGLNAVSNGTVTSSGEGTITFTPDSGFSGEGSFEYTVSDGNGGTDAGFVVVQVTQEPEMGSA